MIKNVDTDQLQKLLPTGSTWSETENGIEVQCHPELEDGDYVMLLDKILSAFKEDELDIIMRPGRAFKLTIKNLDEKTTDSYPPPKYVVKPADNDTGYNLVKKNYHRFLWSWDQFNNMNEEGNGKWGWINLGEISGEGEPDGFPGFSASGFKKRNDEMTKDLPSYYYKDPDSGKKKMKHLKWFEDLSLDK